MSTKPGFEPTQCFVSMKAARNFTKSRLTEDQFRSQVATGSIRIGMPAPKPGHRSIFDLNLGKGQWLVKYIQTGIISDTPMKG